MVLKTNSAEIMYGEIQTMTAGNESEAQGSRGGAGRGRNGSWVENSVTVTVSTTDWHKQWVKCENREPPMLQRY